MTTYQTADKTIKLPFPEKLYSEFTSKHGVENDGFSEEKIKELYVFVVESFSKGESSIDTISSICTKLFDKVVQITKKEETDLFQAVLAGSELAFYVRNPNLLPQFNGFLKEVFNYAEEFKKEL